MAKHRHIPCAIGGNRHVRKERVIEQFGEFLHSVQLPSSWREMVQHKMLETLRNAGADLDAMKRERERLQQKRTRVLKQYREGHIDDKEYDSEMASVELALRRLDTPEIGGIKIEDVLAIGERLPEMASLWKNATTEEQREMIMLLVEPGGISYDLDAQQIAALMPRPAFFPLLELSAQVKVYDEAPDTLVTSWWRPDIRYRSSAPSSLPRRATAARASCWAKPPNS